VTAPGPPESTKRSKRMVGFYVGLGAAVLLFVGAWFAYEPLRLRYAIHRMRSTNYHKHKDIRGRADRWLLLCVNEAIRGNRAAMRAVMLHPTVDMFPTWPGMPQDVPNEVTVIYPVATSQEKLFFEVLATMPDEEAIRVLQVIAAMPIDEEPGGGVSGQFSRKRPSKRIQNAVRIESAYIDLGNYMISRRPEISSLKDAAFKFIEHRFAKELVTAREWSKKQDERRKKK
jgi:hypothetical protein